MAVNWCGQQIDGFSVFNFLSFTLFALHETRTGYFVCATTAVV